MKDISESNSPNRNTTTPERQVELLYKDEVYAIIGAAIEMHRELGSGFLEAVYQEALEIELQQRGVPFESQPTLPIFYKGRRLKKEYVADVVGYDKIIEEKLSVPSREHCTACVSLVDHSLETQCYATSFSPSTTARRACAR
jgi:GxxExxY protein